MALDKFPVEVPLGGNVDEGTVPVVTQPPRLREVTDCVSIKGGAYEKKDGLTDPRAIAEDTLAIEYATDSTVSFRPTLVNRYGDDGGSSESYASPVTGRVLRAYSPTESDAVKDFADHASLELDDGTIRTMCVWNVDPRGTYVLKQDGSNAGGPTPTPSMYYQGTAAVQTVPRSYVYYEAGNSRYAMFDGETQIGAEQTVPGVEPAESAAYQADGNNITGGPTTFSRLRADPENGIFWMLSAQGYVVESAVGNTQFGFTMATRESPGPGATTGTGIRDITNTLPNPTNNENADPVQPGSRLSVYDADGVLLDSTILDPNGDTMGSPLDLIYVPGQGVYALHWKDVPGLGVPENFVSKWSWDAGTSSIVPEARIQPSVGPLNYRTYFPIGLHDTKGPGPAATSEKVCMILYLGTLVFYDYALTAGAELVADSLLPNVAGLPPGPTGAGNELALTIDRRTAFPRMSLTDSDAYRTYMMKCGIWGGSFMVPIRNDVGDITSYWVGIQRMTTGLNVPPSAPSPPLTISDPPVAFAGVVDHYQVSAVLPSQGENFGRLTGAVIGSHAEELDGLGPSVVLYVGAPGDDRTAIAQKVPPALADAPTSTMVLATLRFSDVPRVRWQPLAVLQLQPGSQCLGTYQNNMFQIRTNLYTRPDGRVAMLSFERSSPLEYTSDETAADEAQVKTGGGSSKSRPLIGLLDPEPAINTAVAGDYALASGAQLVTTAGPQGLAGGWGPQPIVEYVRLIVQASADDSLWVDRGLLLADTLVGALPTAEYQTFGYAAHAVTYDESGGEHRTVPHSTALAAQYEPGPSPVTYRRCYGHVQPIPYVLFGVPNSGTAIVELYVSGPDGSTPPTQVGTAELTVLALTASLPIAPVVPPQNDASLSLLNVGLGAARPGSQEALYTDSGELAADAPQPSVAVAAANSRCWSVSSINPRTVQYSKLLRRGYAPEWNGNLTIRVPGAEDPLTAIGVLPDGRVLLFSSHAVYYTYGEGPSDTGQGSGFAEPAALTDTVGCTDARSVVYGDFGCMFRGERGFYRIDRRLSMTYVGLPYEDTTAGGVVSATAIDGLRSEVIFYTEGGERWVFNYLRDQWQTFQEQNPVFTATERRGRPWTAETVPGGAQLVAPTDQPAAVTPGAPDTGLMSLKTGWLAMGRIQGFGRVWELQIEGSSESASGMRVELSYDYIDAPTETFSFDAPATGGRIKLRMRPRRQKCESMSVRISEYVPAGVLPSDCTGWQAEMLTLLCGVKVGLDKIPTTETS